MNDESTEKTKIQQSPGDTVEGMSGAVDIRMYQCGHLDCRKEWMVIAGERGLLFCPYCGCLNSF